MAEPNVMSEARRRGGWGVCGMGPVDEVQTGIDSEFGHCGVQGQGLRAERADSEERI